MSTYTVTAGKGKAVHAASNGETLCGTEKRPNGTLVLLNSNDDVTCKNCMKLVDNTKETETVDEHLNTMSDAERFSDDMAGHDYKVETTRNDETGMVAVVTRAAFPSGTRVTTRAVWHNGVFSYARHVVVDALGHHMMDLSESEVASMTYSRNYAAEAA